MQLAQIPAAVAAAEGFELALQGAATGITAGVVVAKDAGERQGQLG
jgi:hypothetical protein